MRRILPLALVVCALAGAGCGDDAKVAGGDTRLRSAPIPGA